MDKLSTMLREEFDSVQIEINEKKKGDSIRAIEEAVEDKRVYYYPSPVCILIGQLKFASGYFVALQCLIGILMFIFIYHMRERENTVYDYLSLLSAFAAFINVFMMIAVNKTFSYHMAEIEQSCYWNLKQLCACKMICFGGTGLALLLGLLIVAGQDMEVGIFRFGVYIMVPFFISNLIYLFVFTEFRKMEKEYTQYMLAFLLGIAAAVPPQLPRLYESVNFGIWLLLLFAAACGLVYESIRMLNGMEEGEECWN